MSGMELGLAIFFTRLRAAVSTSVNSYLSGIWAYLIGEQANSGSHEEAEGGSSQPEQDYPPQGQTL